MVKVEKDKSASAMTLAEEGRIVFEHSRANNVIPVLNALLDQNQGHPLPSITEWSFCGPVADLLRMMIERLGGTSGIPEDVGSFVEWLKLPETAKRVRAAQIHVSFPPHPRNGKESLIRLERAATLDEYRSATA